MPRAVLLALSLLPTLLTPALSAPVPPPQAAGPTCPPAEAAGPPAPMPAVATAIRRGGHLGILVIGSAAVLGPRSGGNGFPVAMVKALTARLPRVSIHLTLRGHRRWSAGDMLPVLEKALAAGGFQLVVWQTGSVEAMHNLPPVEFSNALNEGASLVARAGADLVLVDMQFSRFLRANADLDPYESAMEQVAALPRVSLFHRFDLTHGWVENEGLDVERAAAPALASTAERVQACVGRALAGFVIQGASASHPDR